MVRRAPGAVNHGRPAWDGPPPGLSDGANAPSERRRRAITGFPSRSFWSTAIRARDTSTLLSDPTGLPSWAHRTRGQCDAEVCCGPRRSPSITGGVGRSLALWPAAARAVHRGVEAINRRGGARRTPPDASLVSAARRSGTPCPNARVQNGDRGATETRAHRQAKPCVLLPA